VELSELKLVDFPELAPTFEKNNGQHLCIFRQTVNHIWQFDTIPRTFNASNEITKFNP